MQSIVIFILAAFFEISGCFAFWSWLRAEKSPWWVLLGMSSLALFAILLTKSDVEFAGRAYAAYGGIYVMSSVLWMWAVEGKLPDRWDISGGIVCIAGAAIILLGKHATG